MKARIHTRARELGFDACHFTTASPAATSPRFRQWLAGGRHGQMAYLERNAPKRIDPQLVLPGARSVITLATSYAGETASSEFRVSSSEFGNGSEGKGQVESVEHGFPPHPGPLPQGEGDPNAASGGSQSTQLGTRDSELGSRRGLIARYARFTDYHEILGERLKLLAEYVNQLGGAVTKSLWYVDTGPVLERDLAERSGLGFIGKHTNVISRKFGNWIFLAEVITTLELEPDAPEKNRCGSCTRCLSACPTQAITAPFQLDARRCISYLTIELKGSIPIEFRPAIGDRIYGCDDCLAVCPWNRFAREGSLMKNHARPDLAQPDLLNLLSFDEAEFKRRFDATPLRRAKRKGLLRNVCVALGNVGDETALPALERAAAGPEPLIAEHAAWAIAQIETRCAPDRPALDSASVPIRNAIA